MANNQIKDEDNANKITMNEFREYSSTCLLNNKALPFDVRLSRDTLEKIDYIVDNHHKDQFRKGVQEIEVENGERFAEMQKKLSLLRENVVRPLDNFFVKGIKVADRIVRSFPCGKPSSDFLELRASIFKEYDDEGLVEKEEVVSICVKEDLEVDESDCTEDTPRKQDNNAQIKGSISRKILRQKRRAELKSKITNGHNEKDDPRDLEAIQKLENSVGDWKLKASRHYSVPVERQVDTRSKLKELITCEESLYNAKTAFNEELMALQDERYILMDSIKVRNEKVLEISEELHEQMGIESLWSPCDQDGRVNDHCEHERNESDPQLDLTQQKNKKPLSRQQVLAFTSVVSASFPCSSIEREERYEKEVLLRHEMSNILSLITDDVQKFDQSLHKLKKKRFELGIDLTNCEIRQSLMVRELIVLASVEKEGNDLVSNRDLCNSKKIEIKNLLENQRGKLEEKKAQLDLCLDQEKSLNNEYQRLIQDHDYLKKIYMKKAHNGNFYSDDEDSEDSDWESVDEEDCCPEGCPQDLYETVLRLRDKKHSLEDKLRMTQRETAITRRTYDQLCSKLKQAQRKVDSTERQIQDFQDGKQKALNEINTFIPMNAKQMFQGQRHEESTECQNVVFSRRNLEQLYLRTHEMQDKICNDKKIVKKLRMDKNQLELRQQEMKHATKRLEEQCDDVQKLKFGQLIDLEAFDAIVDTASATEENGGKELLEVGKQHDLEVKKLEAEIESLKITLNLSTSTNTNWLKKIGRLKQKRFETSQNNKKAKEMESTTHNVEIDNDEEQRLKDVCKKQTNEIEMLKTAIHKLTRKNGNVFHLQEYRPDPRKTN